MGRWTVTLHLLLLFITRSSFARGVSDSEPAEPREYPCPVDTEIAPCVCTYDSVTLKLSMDCSDARTDQDLVDAFSAIFPFTTFDTLKIDQTDGNFDSHKLETLTQYSFGDVSFEHVEITGTSLKTVEEGAFRNSHETLISLRLQSNEIWSFTFEILGEFTKLTRLTLNGNDFNGVPIQPISSMSLTVLNLNNNPMVNVGGDFVKDCPALEQLFLQTTGQESVPHLDESPISLIHGLENIYSLDFSGNSISTLQTNIFSTSTSAPPGTITTIDLSDNIISTVFPNFVTGLVDDPATLINLSNNLIEFMDQEVWEDIFTAIGEGTVDMTGNPLLCGCDIAWLVYDTTGLRNVLSPETKCHTGNLVSELPASAFDQCR